MTLSRKYRKIESKRRDRAALILFRSFISPILYRYVGAGYFVVAGRAHGASRCEAEERERGAASVRRAFVCATAFP